MSILTILTLIFMVLKLMNYIDWHWAFVVAPSILYIVIWLWAAIYKFTRTPEQRLEATRNKMLQNYRESRGL